MNGTLSLCLVWLGIAIVIVLMTGVIVYIHSWVTTHQTTLTTIDTNVDDIETDTAAINWQKDLKCRAEYYKKVQEENFPDYEALVRGLFADKNEEEIQARLRQRRVEMEYERIAIFGY